MSVIGVTVQKAPFRALVASLAASPQFRVSLFELRHVPSLTSLQVQNLTHLVSSEGLQSTDSQVRMSSWLPPRQRYKLLLKYRKNRFQMGNVLKS